MCFPVFMCQDAQCVYLHHLLISIAPGGRRGGKVWRQREKKWLVWERLGAWKRGSEIGNWREEIKAVTEKVKEFLREEVAERVEDGEEEEFGRARSPWKWETESMTAEECQDSCVFLMAHANVWVLSILNEYRAFSFCEFLNNFPSSTASGEKGSLPQGLNNRVTVRVFFGRKEKN